MAHLGVKITELPVMANMLANSAMPIVDMVLDETQQTNVAALGTFILNNIGPTVTSNLGSISNVTILGGSAGFKLTTHGNGTLYWSADANTMPGGPNTTVQYNNNGTFAGSNAFVFNSVSNTLTVTTTNITGNLTSGNANLGNFVEANVVNVASNLTSNNLTVNLALSGNTANFTGNVVLPNLTVNLQLDANTANVNTINSNIVNVTANANLGQVANVKILGGANGQILSTDGAGNLTWKPDSSFPTVGNGGNASTSLLMLASLNGGNAFSVYT